MGEERLGNGVTGYRFGSEVLNIPVWERMKEGETHYWNFRCPEILRLKLRGKIGKRRKINPTARTGLFLILGLALTIKVILRLEISHMIVIQTGRKRAEAALIFF